MRRVVLVGACCLVVLVVAGFVTMSRVLGRGPDAAAEPAASRETVQVARKTLTRSAEEAGTLGYGSSWPLGTGASGTVTWLPDPGVVLDRGSVAVRVDEKSVVVLTGALPLYRSLTIGAKGADVRQLEENLQALGYGGFTVDENYDAKTAHAVRELQRTLGLERTGEVTSSWVSVIPAPARVSRHDVRVGEPAGERLLTVTGTDHLATVDLPIADRDLARVGGPVTVVLPGGVAAAGTITSIDPPVARESEDGVGVDPSDATVRVTVRIDDPAVLGDLDVTPVTVNFAAEEHAGVLAVPVRALVALAEGGYAVEVATGSSTRLVRVTTGLFADGFVEITSDGTLTEGEDVVVAS